MRDRVGKGDYDIAIGNWSPDFADPYMRVVRVRPISWVNEMVRLKPTLSRWTILDT